MTYETRNGFLWPSADRDCWQAVFQEVPKIAEVMKFVRGTRTCVQAGGNCGVFPKELAKHFLDVFTFEPHSENYHCLEQNVPELNVRKYQAALGANKEPVRIAPANGGEENNYGAFHVEKGGEILCMTVDEFNLLSCDLIYLDIEGAEYDAILGAKNTIAEHKPVIVVEDKGLEKVFGRADGATRALIESMGYKEVLHTGNDKVFVPC